MKEMEEIEKELLKSFNLVDPAKWSPGKSSIASADERRSVDTDDTGTGELPPKAVFVVHGMGQQLPFETLDSVADGLYTAEKLATGRAGRPVSARNVRIGDELLQRADVELTNANGKVQPVHIYEAYWSPLTEGVVTLRDVFMFLIDAGMNALRNKGGEFRRRMFGREIRFPVAVRTQIYFFVALATVASLGIINAAIIAIPAARSPFSTPPSWLSDQLFMDITSLFKAVELVLLAFGLIMFIGMAVTKLSKRAGKKKRAVGVVAGLLGVGGFVASLGALISAGVALPVLFMAHGRWDPKVEARRTFFPEVLIPGDWFTCVIIGIAAVAILALIAYPIFVVALGTLKRLVKDSSGRTFTVLVFLIAGAIIAAPIWLASQIIAASESGSGASSWPTLTKVGETIIWALLVGVGIFCRKFLVQYLGDVAAYLQQHKVDRFHEVRQRIRQLAMKLGKAVYSNQALGGKSGYEQVVIVGHSLGSVVAYDTLNRLLVEDSVAAVPMNVAARTPLLLTFGSPLDKTAYIFANQSRSSMTDVRERLAEVVQPLIEQPSVRKQVEWVNLHSPWDIISGALNFFDDPNASQAEKAAMAVRNLSDPDAVTWLAAHNEYWKNPLLFTLLRDKLI